MASGLAALLRAARTAVGISQLELALRLGISQRHVSFVELDRAKPGRDLLMSWLRELRASPSQINAALLQAGYAPLETIAPDAHDESVVAPALERALALHDPNPGFVFDADWHIVRMNAGATWLCGLLTHDSDSLMLPIDMLEVLADPKGWLTLATDPITPATALLHQLRTEEWLRPELKARVDMLEASLLSRFGPLAARRPGQAISTLFEVTFATTAGPLAFTAIQTLPGLPQDAPLGTHRAELWYPADQATAIAIRTGPCAVNSDTSA